MSFLSRLLGLIFAAVPGLGFLALSLLFVPRWSELGVATGFFYSLVSFITGAVCLYLGISIMFGRDEATPEPVRAPESAPTLAEPQSAPAPLNIPPMQPAPLPTPEPTAEPVSAAPPASSVFAAPSPAPASPLDTPEARIRRLAETRPQWQVTAPQLAQLANLGLAATDAAARQIASEGDAQIESGPNGEVVYRFDLAGN